MLPVARARELIAIQFEKLDATAERVLREVAEIAFSDPRRYEMLDDDGHVVLFPWSDMPDGGFASVAEISPIGAFT